MSSDVYFLYGSHASYYTAKTRSYLRKKGIPFVERVPAHPRFREHVRPSSENHRIPQLEAPDGTVVQDTVAIFDFLEERFPEPAATPPGPKQQIAARLFEALIDLALIRLAWHFRWNYMDENYRFVGREFGRSFKPQGSDDEIDHYGQVIADRMSGHRKSLGDSAAFRRALDAAYLDWLALFERHFTTLPFLFGGLPSVADHGLMGPLYGHLARDPEPARLMKLHAPRTFRWTEHMNTPEIQAPEFADFETAYLPNDEIPETTVEMLRRMIADGGDALVRMGAHFEKWLATHGDHPSGTAISPQGHDEAVVGSFETDYRGVSIPMAANTYQLWVLQRATEWFHAQGDDDRAAAREFIASLGGEALLDFVPARRLVRVGSRMGLA